MNKYLVIIFDFDGTIADTMNLELLNLIADRFSAEFDLKKMKDIDLKELRNKETKEVFKTLGIPLIKIPQFLKKARIIINEEIENIKLIQGIEELLSQLKSSEYGLGILTSSPKDTVEKFLNKNNLNLFNFIYSESNIFNKAKKLKALLKERELSSKYVFYVGDETRDIEAAKKAGVKMIAVTWGYNTEEILRKYSPDYLIREPKELIAILKSS